jgi:hypothetical protein
VDRGGRRRILRSRPGGVAPKLTPAAAAMLKQGAELEAKRIVYDENLSECGPPGFPRWLVIPFLREFIVRPETDLLSSETVNNVRRIYTDGRDHPPVQTDIRCTTATRLASGMARSSSSIPISSWPAPWDAVNQVKRTDGDGRDLEQDRRAHDRARTSGSTIPRSTSSRGT